MDKPSGRRKDITGLRNGRLVAERFIGTKDKRSYWLCKCDCGKETIVIYTNIAYGRNTKSCGCLLDEMFKNGDIHKTHGMSNTKFMRAYYHAKARCENVRDFRYRLYGGRGIKFLWANPEEFKRDMYPWFRRHIKKHGVKDTTLDRTDTNGHYSKINCKWATWKEQQNNRRNTNSKYR